MEGLEVQLVHFLHPLVQSGQVPLPLVHAGAVAADADRLENGVPQLFHGRILSHAVEHPHRPAGDGDGGDAPGEAAAHLEPVKILQGLAAGLLGPDDAAGVHALQILRVRGGDGQVGRPLLGIVVEEMAPPVGHRVEHFLAGPEILHPGHGIVVPVHDHFLAAGVIGLLGAHPGKPGALHRTGDDHPLVLLHIQAHPHQQPGIFPQFFIHQVCHPFRMMLFTCYFRGFYL